MPVNFPFILGTTLSTALALPVDAGMMIWAAPWHNEFLNRALYSIQGGSDGMVSSHESSMMLKMSGMTLTRGAKQLVVQEVLLMILRELSYF
jgi:hypothetical protein